MQPKDVTPDSMPWSRDNGTMLAVMIAALLLFTLGFLAGRMIDEKSSTEQLAPQGSVHGRYGRR